MGDTTPRLAQLDQSLQILDAALTRPRRGGRPELARHARRLDDWLAAARAWLASLESPRDPDGGEGAA